MSLRLFDRLKKGGNGGRPSGARTRAAVSEPPHLMTTYEPAPREFPDDDPLREMLRQQRHAAALRQADRWKTHPSAPPLLQEAEKRLEESLALVPAGEITLARRIDTDGDDGEEALSVAPFLLDVYCVTNAQFQHFVDAGGYDELSLWPEDIWPHIIEMKDRTGTTAPRYWREGRHDRRLSDHPVVGVCWYEAMAYAAWAGKRLPTEAEWQMAASWHVKSDADVLRRFPWGDAMNTQRCNVWLTGLGTTVPVNAYPEGAAPNGVRQLVGNVWEWTSSRFEILDPEGQPIVGEMPMYAVRGAAFDAYFEAQATSQFRTGQIALGRTHNLGFRLAMNLEDAPWMHA
ncbi:MAG: hypothetical protein BroJett003_22790 [Planctomycetota bacterium]|nr:MAG: hypothetical protein BroJett003_22790 [Planctomycetota bacterium]